MSNQWTVEQMPDLNGKTALVTGANSGLGYESSLALAQKGARVILGCRNLEKGKNAKEKIEAEVSGAKLELMELDLASLDSVKSFVEKFSDKHDKLDILINNAGVMALPQGKTKDGFEKQFGINHLGHFALTGLLMDKLEASEAGRVVNVASKAAESGQVNFDDLMSEKSYSKWGAYGQSKLANILFTQELNERLEQAGKSTRSMVAHPGGSSTNLGDKADFSPIMKFVFGGLIKLMAQPAAKGALPQLYAATAHQAQPGKYYGPDGFQELGGYPKEVKVPPQARDKNGQQNLWKVSEELTKVHYL